MEEFFYMMSYDLLFEENVKKIKKSFGQRTPLLYFIKNFDMSFKERIESFTLFFAVF